MTNSSCPTTPVPPGMGGLKQPLLPTLSQTVIMLVFGKPQREGEMGQVISSTGNSEIVEMNVGAWPKSHSQIFLSR